ncbi:fumarylacetoacetate hydrolase family protein [Saccharothrix deserti]|uniref:fumarylacetoacetate hydrolase family protein n=1 Tax=Saccharothrix deserti TaxID=2593674 RepID=UPI00131C3C48|nr:fumarylacetoacetate hydrolase family protein [Saccharothrix deserti]
MLDDKILVTGATGKTGRRVVRLLEERGVPVRAVSRSGPSRFDWADPTTWEPALRDVTAVYLVVADLGSPWATEAVTAFTRQAAAAGVRRAVLLSVPGDGGGLEQESVLAAERAPAEAGLEWTVLRLRWFFQNFSEDFLRDAVMSGELRLPAGDGEEAFIDAEDIAEVAVAALPKDPWFFLKTGAHSVVGDQAGVHPPAKSRELDWEAELAVVIGRHARDVTADRAAEFIAGYTIVNDLSARDLMPRSDRPPVMTYDWMGQKCFDGAAPMGPWITPADYVEDCHDLTAKLWVNDVLKQDSSTDQLIHDVYEQIEWLSHQLTLLPGDVIATGTPAGVGMPRGDYLTKGDVVRIEIEACGELTNVIA